MSGTDLASDRLADALQRVLATEHAFATLLERAADNAKLRAERLARSSGNRVANIISASQGIFQITRPNSTETASWGMYDTSTIEKKVRAVVTMRYRTE